MKNTLLSIPTILDADCEVHLGLKFNKIYKDNKLFLEGDRDEVSRMWTIDLVVPTTTTTTVAKSVRRNSDRNELSKSVRNELVMASHSEIDQNKRSNPHTKISSSLSNIGSEKLINKLIRARNKNNISQYQKNRAGQHDTAPQQDI